MLSPHPDQDQSSFKPFGLGVFAQPHDSIYPNLHFLPISYVTAAASMACVNAASRVPALLIDGVV